MQLCILDELENGTFCPNYWEHKKQRQNYIQLELYSTYSAIAENVPCLEGLKDFAVKHIPHQYSEEMKQPTDTVSLEFLSKVNLFLSILFKKPCYLL